MTEMEREEIRRYIVSTMWELWQYALSVSHHTLTAEQWEQLEPDRAAVRQAFAKTATQFAAPNLKKIGREE